MYDARHVENHQCGPNIFVPACKFVLICLLSLLNVGQSPRLAIGAQNQIHCQVGSSRSLVHPQIIRLHKTGMVKSGKQTPLRKKTPT